MSSQPLKRLISKWRVVKDVTYSDHRVLEFTFNPRARLGEIQKDQKVRFCTRRAVRAAFQSELMLHNPDTEPREVNEWAKNLQTHC